MRQSFSTIDGPEFINLKPDEKNPLMSKCDIKVLYLGQNDNKTCINKEGAAELAKSLRGAPIVGYYSKDDNDFTDHGHVITFDHKGMHVDTKTIPYGFVDPMAPVWFQKFEEEDRDTGQTVIREYLMTTGYIWDGQYPEARPVIEEGRPQSMELDKESISGTWTKDSNGKLNFFIINDAIFTKLCILGDDIEPAFETASVTASNISTTYQFGKEFTKTLFSMMQQLQYALGGKEMADTHINGDDVQVTTRPAKALETNKEPDPSNIIPSIDTSIDAGGDTTPPASAAESTISTRPAAELEKKKSAVDVPNGFIEESEGQKESEDEGEVTTGQVGGESMEEGSDFDFTKKEEDSDKEDDGKEDSDESKDDDDDDKKKKPADKYAELEANYNALVAQVEAMKNEFALLQEFKANAEAEKKDALIAEFYMLSDEDKKDVIDHKNEYSYDDIKAKLAVIAFDKKVNFSLETNDEIENNTEANNVITTFALNNTETNDAPEWVRLVEEADKKRI